MNQFGLGFNHQPKINNQQTIEIGTLGNPMKFMIKFRCALAVLVLALCTTPAFAQGCAMCRANAKATPKEGQRAINRAIFVMLAPPVAFMILGFGLAMRYGKGRDRENENSPE